MWKCMCVWFKDEPKKKATIVFMEFLLEDYEEM